MNARATRFPLFDSLRAIAALCIFATHAYFVMLFSNTSPLRQYATRLDVGVPIFFAISGFLLYRPFVRARLNGGAVPSTGPYAWRRLLRIGPAYWVALTLIAVATHLPFVFSAGDGPLIYGFGQVYKPGTALAGLPQAWSLSVEASFYVFLPLYALVMRSLPLRGADARFRAELGGVAVLVAAGFAFTGLALHSGAVTDFGKPALHLMLPAYLHQFAVGIGLAVLSVRYEEGPLPRWLRPVDRFPGLPWALALVAFWAVSTQVGIDGHIGEVVTGPQYQARTALYAVVALGLVLPAVFGDPARGLVRRLLGHRALLWVGLVSYSLFLYHLFVLDELHRVQFTGSRYLWVPVGLALSLAIAAASYYVIERPAIALKRLVGGPAEPARGEAIAEPAPVAPPHPTS